MPTCSDADRHELLKALCTTAVILGLYVFIATHATLWDRDEPRFARATMEMITSGNWLYPTFEGRLRPDKPILIYWLMAGGVKLLGPTELAFRIPSCLGAAGACLCTFFAARRLGAGRWAWWAMVLLAASLMPTILGTFATADGVLLFFLTAAMTVFAYAFTSAKVTASHVLISGVMLGGAWLTKGPLGLFPGLSLIVAAWWYRRSIGKVPHGESGQGAQVQPPLPPGEGRGEGDDFFGLSASQSPSVLRASATLSQGEKGYAKDTLNHAVPQVRWLILFSIVIPLVIFLTWAIPANIATGSEFARQGLGRHVFARILQPAEGHGGRNLWQYLLLLPFYLPMIVAGFFPGTLLLPGGLHALIGGRLADLRTRAFLWGWFIPVPVLMSLFATKLPHYVMPIWPGLAIVCALALRFAHERKEQMTEWDHRWLRGGAWFFAPISIGFGLLLLLGPMLAPRIDPLLAPLSSMQWAGLITGLWVLGTGLLAVVLQLREQWLRATQTALLGTAVTLLLLWGWVIPLTEPIIKLSPPIAQAIRTHTADEVPVGVFGYYEPSLTLYLMRDRPEKLGEEAQVLSWLSEQPDKPRVLVITLDRWEKILSTNGSIPMRELARVQGINHNEHGQPVVLLALLREADIQ